MNPEIYNSNNYVVLDFETDTSGGQYGRAPKAENKLLLACWRLGPDHPWLENGLDAKGMYHDQAQWGGEYDMAVLVGAIQAADFFVAHNAKYEFGWLKRCGLDLHKTIAFCTQLAEYVLLGNRKTGDKLAPGHPVSLNACVTRRGGPAKDPVVDLLIKHGINPIHIPRSWLQGRCMQDVETTEKLFLAQRKTLTLGGLLPVQYTRNILTPMLAELEFEGLALDPELVKDTWDDYRRQLVVLEAQFEKFTGGINWRSPTQIAEYLYNPPRAWSEIKCDDAGEKVIGRCKSCRGGTVPSDVTKERRARCVMCKGTGEADIIVRHLSGLNFKQLTDYAGNPKTTKSGKPMTDVPTLDALKATTKKQRHFLSLRKELGKVGHALSKSLDFYQGVCTEYGGEFMGEFQQMNTATHRLASGGVPLAFEMYEGNEKRAQFQNQPRIFKKLFRAKREGWYIGEWDGSGMEFRTAIDLSDDVRGYADIVGGHDVHTFTASVLRGLDYDELKERVDAKDPEAKEWRQLAKSDTFKPLYGGSRGTPQQEAYYEAFRKRYPHLAACQESWVNEVVDTKRLITPWGLRYYWPWARRNKKTGYCNATASIYNYPVQAFATAEIIPIAIVRFWQELYRLELQDYIIPVNTVHDSVICEIHPDYPEAFASLAKDLWHHVYDYLHEVYDYDFKVPFGTEIAVGTHWSDDSVLSAQYNIYPDGTEENLAA